MSRINVLAALLIAVLMTTLGCSNDNQANEETGSLNLALELPDGSAITNVHYSITGNGVVPIEGDISVAAPGATASAFVAGIPAGTGYTVTLTATADDGATCSGSSDFDIVAYGLTYVTVRLHCLEVETDGALDINSEWNLCPEIDTMTIAPLVTTAGNDIALTATASDGDGHTLTSLWWTDTGGSFAVPTDMNTTYTCDLIGVQNLFLTVDDGYGCTDTAGYFVTCLEVGACGDGEVNPGEECDDSNIDECDGCSPTCRTEACGNGIVDCGESCDDGGYVAGDGCSPICQLEGCGNGTIDPGEACDDGDNDDCDGCSAICTVESCGNGTVDCGETCDDGNTDDGDGCSAMCQTEGCGNGTVDPGETCDDGNVAACDDCSATCQVEECGNGVLECTEECDDGNLDVGDGCDASCVLEPTVACALIYNLDAGDGTDGCNVQVSDTTAGMGDLIAGVGGGTLVLVVPSDGGQNPAAGPAQVVYYQLTKEFDANIVAVGLTVSNEMSDSAGLPDGSVVVATGTLALGGVPTVVWDACTYPADYDDVVPASVANAPPTPAELEGSFNPEVIGTGTGCLAPYRSVGTVSCADGGTGFCTMGGLLVGPNPQDLTWEQALQTFEFSANFSTFSMPFTQTPNLQPARTYLSLGGTLASKVCQ